MPAVLENAAVENAIEIHVNGKLTADDYRRFVPDLERRIAAHGKLRILVVLHDFAGWDAGGFWEDLKLDVKHFNDVERLAVVGESQWQKGMTTMFKPFTAATVRFFESDQLDAARQWINEL